MTIPEKEMLRKIEKCFSSAIRDCEEGDYAYDQLCMLAVDLATKFKLNKKETEEFLEWCGVGQDYIEE